MSEALKNLTLLLWAMCAIYTDAYAAEKQGVAEENNLQNAAEAPTIVYGSAQNASGGEDSFVVEQPDGAQNPLGDPLPEPQMPPEDYTLQPNQPSQQTTSENSAATTSSSLGNGPQGVPVVGQNANGPQGVPVVGDNSAQELGNQFQNTLMEANGMVYDVQAFPEADVPVISDPSNPETIYSPNVNP